MKVLFLASGARQDHRLKFSKKKLANFFGTQRSFWYRSASSPVFLSEVGNYTFFRDRISLNWVSKGANYSISNTKNHQLLKSKLCCFGSCGKGVGQLFNTPPLFLASKRFSSEFFEWSCQLHIAALCADEYDLSKKQNHNMSNTKSINCWKKSCVVFVVAKKKLVNFSVT